MTSLAADPQIAELAFLDIIDVTPALTWRLNPAFVDGCIEALDVDPRKLETVVADAIIARALERGYVVTNILDMTLRALEIGAEEAEAS